MRTNRQALRNKKMENGVIVWLIFLTLIKVI